MKIQFSEQELQQMVSDHVAKLLSNSPMKASSVDFNISRNPTKIGVEIELTAPEEASNDSSCPSTIKDVEPTTVIDDNTPDELTPPTGEPSPTLDSNTADDESTSRLFNRG